GDISSLDGRISTNETDISSLDGRVTVNEGNISVLQGDFTSLNTRVTTNEGNISTLQTDLTTLESSLGSAAFETYEEGSWIPEILTSNGQVGRTYSTQAGTYIKIGKQVFCKFQVTLSSKGTSVGNV